MREEKKKLTVVQSVSWWGKGLSEERWGAVFGLSLFGTRRKIPDSASGDILMEKKVCFVICPIGENESDTRKRSDKMFKHLITPAVKPLGYDPLRSDKISEPGMITGQIIQHIVEDSLVIADLTERNANVFYELALRHVLRLPYIQIIKTGERIPFDVAGARTISVDETDLDSVETAKTDITNQIQSLEKDSSKLETPISISIDLSKLRQSDNPEQRTMADVLGILNELRSTIVEKEGKQEAERKLEMERLIRQANEARAETMGMRQKEGEHLEIMIVHIDKFAKYRSKIVQEAKGLKAAFDEFQRKSGIRPEIEPHLKDFAIVLHSFLETTEKA
jgi:hypothetical protein